MAIATPEIYAEMLDRAKAGAGGHARHGHAAAPVANEGVARLKQGAREPAVGGKLSHQQEQRYHRQVVDGKPGIGAGFEVAHQRQGAGHHGVADRSGQQHGNTDVYPHGQHQQHGPEHEGAPFNARHDAILRRLSCSL